MKIGKLDRREAEAARNACQAKGASAIELLASGDPQHEEDLAAAIAHGLGLPLLKLATVSIDEWAADLVDEATATRFALIAVGADDETVTLVMANPFDQEAIKYVEFATERRVRRAVGARGDILQAVSEVYSHAKTLATVLAGVPEDASVEVIPGTTPSSEAHDIDPRKLAQEAEQAPIIKMVNLILVDAITSKASDIHIEPSPNVVLVRYRLDGMLVEGHQLPKWVQNPLTARIKIMAKADITERRTPQDGHFTIRHDERLVDVRVSVLPTTDGEKFVLRLLDPNATSRKLDALGMSPQDLAKIRQLIRKPEGMILVTGPTGSGKSSTLCAMIEEIFSPHRNIVTIENPVEFNIKGVTQVEVNEKQGLTFASVLRSVLRQDPDVIMVGEIRDRETAEIAFRAAQTGHLVLSTLHTNDTVSTITRLLDLGIEPYLIAPSLIAIIAQRLVRKVCERCAEPAVGEDPTLHRERRLREGKGCAVCHGTGYVGRTGCYEVLEISKGMQRLIEAKAPESQIRMLGEDEGMISLRENTLVKVEGGLTTDRGSGARDSVRVSRAAVSTVPEPGGRAVRHLSVLPSFPALGVSRVRHDAQEELDELPLLRGVVGRHTAGDEARAGRAEPGRARRDTAGGLSGGGRRPNEREGEDPRRRRLRRRAHVRPHRAAVGRKRRDRGGSGERGRRARPNRDGQAASHHPRPDDAGDGRLRGLPAPARESEDRVHSHSDAHRARRHQEQEPRLPGGNGRLSGQALRERRVAISRRLAAAALVSPGCEEGGLPNRRDSQPHARARNVAMRL